MFDKTHTIARAALLVGIALASAGSWTLTGCKKSEPPAEQTPVRPVKTMVLEAAEDTVERSYPGEVRPADSVELAFQVGGPLIELPVRRGEEVKQGQLLARIDPRDFKNELDASQAVRNEAKATLARYEQAAKTGAVSKQQVAEQKAQVDVAQADLNIKKKAHDDTFLKAPYAGRIAEKYVTNFQNIQATVKVLSLQNIEQIEVIFYVPERDVVTVRRENPGRFIVTSGSLPGREFDAELKEYATDADPATQTFKAKLVMPAPEDVNILPGMTVQVTWFVPTADNEQVSTFWIPANAVFSPEAEKQMVWLVDPSAMTVSRKEVALGELSDNNVAVKDGLAMGDTIAISGVHHLREGMRIRSIEPTSQEASK